MSQKPRKRDALGTSHPPPKFPRHPIEMGRVQAERQLFEFLEDTASRQANSQDFGRQAVREALDIVLEFLRLRGLSGQAMKPLTDLLHAFDDVRRGVLPEMFDPKSADRYGAEGSRKWSKSSKAEETDLYLAACADALVRLKGLEPEFAFANVARDAQKWPRVSSGIITEGRVRDLYFRYRQSAKSDKGTRSVYASVVENLSLGPRAAGFLDEVLRDGPPLTGGSLRSKYSNQ